MLLNYFAKIMRMIGSFRNLSVVLILFSFFLLNASAANVTGTVVDSEGAAIGKAQIVIRADSSGRREAVKGSDLILETDAKGHFSANLSAGFYDICVMANAFSPYCEKLLVGTTPLTPKIQLRADPEVMRHLGDVF